MCVERWLTEHRIWIDVLSSFGTVAATAIALFLAWTVRRDLRRERLSGLAIGDVEPDGTAFLANNTRVDLQFSPYKCDSLIDPRTEVPSYRPLLSASSLNNARWVLMNDGITLSPGERLAIHLTNLDAEETFVSLVALKVVAERRTRYWVYRFAGIKARNSASMRDSTHPHLKWVLEFGLMRRLGLRGALQFSAQRDVPRSVVCGEQRASATLWQLVERMSEDQPWH